MRRGFPAGTPRNRLSVEQRQIILGMLRVMTRCSDVTRAYNARVGRVTLATVCAIRRQAIAQGELIRSPLKKERGVAQ
jgi:hypothetical protein